MCIDQGLLLRQGKKSVELVRGKLLGSIEDRIWVIRDRGSLAGIDRDEGNAWSAVVDAADDAGVVIDELLLLEGDRRHVQQPLAVIGCGTESAKEVARRLAVMDDARVHTGDA